jgi:hypothetical protein
MNNGGGGIQAACGHLAQAIEILDDAGEDMEAANLSLSLERLASKYHVNSAGDRPADPE